MKTLFKEGTGKAKYLIPLALFLLGVILIIAGMILGGSGGSRSVFSSLTGQSRESELEAKIKSLCEQVDGVSEVTVAVSLTDTSAEATAGNIAGVGIVCRGGEAPLISARLTSLISAACGIRSNRIYVTGAGN